MNDLFSHGKCSGDPDDDWDDDEGMKIIEDIFPSDSDDADESEKTPGQKGGKKRRTSYAMDEYDKSDEIEVLDIDDEEEMVQEAAKRRHRPAAPNQPARRARATAQKKVAKKAAKRRNTAALFDSSSSDRPALSSSESEEAMEGEKEGKEGPDGSNKKFPYDGSDALSDDSGSDDSDSDEEKIMVVIRVRLASSPKEEFIEEEFTVYASTTFAAIRDGLLAARSEDFGDFAPGKFQLRMNNVDKSMEESPSSLDYAPDIDLLEFVIDDDAELHVVDPRDDESAVKIKVRLGKLVRKWKVARNGLLRAVFARFAEEAEVPAESLLFEFDGEDIGPDDTPQALGIEDDDIIEVHSTSSRREAMESAVAANVPKELKIRVRRLSQKPYTINGLDTESTVDSLLQKIVDHKAYSTLNWQIFLGNVNLTATPNERLGNFPILQDGTEVRLERL